MRRCYRYYANNGTFWAHRWLRNGANRAKIGEMKTARDMIAQAIQDQAERAFWPRKYQLMAMDWIANPYEKDAKGKPYAQTLADFMSNSNSLAYGSSITGLSGIVVLGNAWESIDIFHALSGALAGNDKATLQYLAILRCRELMTSGKKSLLPDDKSAPSLEARLRIDDESLNYVGNLAGIHINLQNQAAIETVYKRLRTEAEEWQTHRTSYMMARLKAGRHPDTDKTFWKDWHDTKPPSLDVAWYSEREAKSRNNSLRQMSDWFLAFVPLTLVIAGTLVVLRRKRLRS